MFPMLEILIFILVASAVCCGIHNATEKDYALHFMEKISDWALTRNCTGKCRSRFVYYLMKPLGTCARCTATIYTPLTYLAIYHRLDWMIIILIPAVSFLNGIIISLWYKIISHA